MNLIQKIVEKNNNKNFFLIYNRIPVEVLGEVSANVRQVIENLETLLPEHLIVMVKSIKIGDFSFLNSREVNALYDDESGTIYITNQQDSNTDLLDDLVHEISHSVEDLFMDHLYSDGDIEREFLAKRNALGRELKYDYEVGHFDFSNAEYSENFDELLYRTVGYDKLRNYTDGLFASPYGATSLREYFANCFEEYYLGDRDYLGKLCPATYRKIDFINYGEE